MEHFFLKLTTGVVIGTPLLLWAIITTIQWLGWSDYKSLTAVLKAQWRWIRSKHI